MPIGPNGLSLCSLHHKLFDLGVFTLTPGSQKIVFSEHAVAGTRGLTGEPQHHGKNALVPTSNEATPGAHFLEWNWRHVFKKEARQLDFSTLVRAEGDAAPVDRVSYRI